MDKWKVLVVEDDPPVRNLITVTLSAEDYSVFSAVNGSEAVSEAACRNPDIILLDHIIIAGKQPVSIRESGLVLSHLWVAQDTVGSLNRNWLDKDLLPMD